MKHNIIFEELKNKTLLKGTNKHLLIENPFAWLNNCKTKENTFSAQGGSFRVFGLFDAVLFLEDKIGIASFIASSFLAFINTPDLSISSFSRAFFPSRSNPNGTFPSAHIPFN
jgi:hypothetical protein